MILCKYSRHLEVSTPQQLPSRATKSFACVYIVCPGQHTRAHTKICTNTRYCTCPPLPPHLRTQPHTVHKCSSHAAHAQNAHIHAVMRRGLLGRKPGFREDCLLSVTLVGVLRPTLCNVSATREIARASSWQHPPAKNKATSKSPVGDISVVTLIRTDTTLDHSQKAEKV